MSKRLRSKRTNTCNHRIPVTFMDTKPLDIPVTYPTRKYTEGDFGRHLGQWVEFKTSWGTQQGIIEEVKNNAVLIKMRNSDTVTHFVNYLKSTHHDIQHAGFDGIDGGFPFHRRGPWCWCWFPIVIIVFIFPWFCW